MNLRRLEACARAWCGDAPIPIALIATAGIVAGWTVAAGWLWHDPVLVRGGLGGAAIVLAGALCLVLSGLGLLLAGHDGPVARVVATASAGLLIVVAGAMLAETLLDLDLGVDLASLHRWLDDENQTPGRMSPITSAGFAVCGGVLLMLRLATARTWIGVLELLIFMLLVIGILDLLSNWLDIEALYGWQDAAPETVPTGVALIVLGISIWLRFHAPTSERTRMRREEWHLTVVAAEILAVIALVAGLSGFAILQQSLESAFVDGLEDNLADRRRSFDNSIRDAMQANAMVANRPVLARVVDQFNTGADPTARRQLEESATVLRSFGYKYLAYKDRQGNTLASAGEASAALEVLAPLNTANGAALAWGERGFVLFQQLPMALAGTPVGSVVAERDLPSLTTAYHNVGHIGATADSRMCALRAGGSSCFPTALAETAARGGTSLTTSIAMTHALEGRQGQVKYRDYRGQHVVAAYGPVGTLGLGLVLKIDLVELYAPIRRELEFVFPVLLLFVAAGTLCLRTQITPLARRLRELATIDGLTAAYNRRAFLRFAESELAIARRYGRPVSVMMLDADHFKKVNDVHGHDAGDAVLRALAATCRKELRDVDLFGRLGGEEFAVALPETPIDGAKLVAERLRAALANLEVPAGGSVLKFTVSIGLVSLAARSDTIEGLLKAADEALYVSKQGGRNRVTVAPHSAPAPTLQPVAMPVAS